jgi:tRNA A37 threonylcarbamoyltransferase TsaD
VHAILAQVEEAEVDVSVSIGPSFSNVMNTTVAQVVYLVGGFSASPYLVSRLKERLSEHGITVHIPDGQT